MGDGFASLTQRIGFITDNARDRFTHLSLNIGQQAITKAYALDNSSLIGTILAPNNHEMEPEAKLISKYQMS